MIPDLLLKINGSDLTMPGSVWLTVAIVVYCVLGILLVGRTVFNFFVYETCGRPDAFFLFLYGVGALICSATWPVVIAVKWIGKGLIKLFVLVFANKVSKRHIS